MKEKKRFPFVLSLAIVAVIAVTAGIGLWFFQVKQPHDLAIDRFTEIAASVEAKNAELDAAVSALQQTMESAEKPYDPATLEDGKTAVSEAQQARREVPPLPDNIQEINSEAEKLEGELDYSQELARLKAAQAAVENSIQQMKQVTNPPEEFVLQRLKTLSALSGIQAVTEDHDPNGKLNKQGGYTAAIYFASPLIDPEEVWGEDIVEKGTEGGGCIEVYPTIEDAEARNTYLAAFDGAGMFNSGSHAVVGTIVVRTSPKLTATQQKDLEQQITEALLALQEP